MVVVKCRCLLPVEQMASLENRSVSNLIEVMADERWKRLAEQQGI